jgi:3-mercaptopyruvate sulfurtransferase SseA
MRNLILLFLAFIVGAGVIACNSNESLISQTPRPATKSTAATPPPDNARRITAEELHTHFEANDVVIIDTRAEPAYKQEHIKGAILVPAGTLNAKFDQLPKGKLIVAYCT